MIGRFLQKTVVNGYLDIPCLNFGKFVWKISIAKIFGTFILTVRVYRNRWENTLTIIQEHKLKKEYPPDFISNEIDLIWELWNRSQKIHS